MIRKRFVKKQPTIFVTANHNIRVPEVRVLDERGEMLGVMTTRDAIQRAQTEDKDLILVTEKAKPPIAKIIELAKYKYQIQQKEAESRKNARKQEIKEVRFSPFMGDGDYQTKLNRVIEFLEDGDKVRLVTTEFKGRLVTKKEFGQVMLEKVITETAEIATVEIRPQAMGKKMMAQLMPGKKKKE
ncbi:MAG: translation initiation factor IF-3 [bacterium]|nr:translation initiation factor IF-3 [bacterium]